MNRFVPQYFERTWESGIPTLTEEGWKVVREELAEEGQFSLEEFELDDNSDTKSV